jgi:hypothetical protein
MPLPVAAAAGKVLRQAANTQLLLLRKAVGGLAALRQLAGSLQDRAAPCLLAAAAAAAVGMGWRKGCCCCWDMVYSVLLLGTGTAGQ